MTVVSDTIIAHLPPKTKITPSGWRSFDAVCCIHNGQNADKRQRGGVMVSGDNFSYHCFNCGFKASWQPGRPLSGKIKLLMHWLGASDDTINKLALAVLKINEGVEAQIRDVVLPTFEHVSLPDGAERITSDSVNDGNSLLQIKEYMSARKLLLDDGYNYYYSKHPSYSNRLIIPYYYNKEIVGWTARAVLPDKKPKYLSQQQQGFVFNLDHQTHNKVFTIVVEGPIDAIHIDGVALMGSEISDTQAMLLARLNREIIVLPDRDKAGKKLVSAALDRGYSVSMPDWSLDINDVNDAVLKYGRLYTLYSIVSAAESSPLKIKLKEKKWFAN